MQHKLHLRVLVHHPPPCLHLTALNTLVSPVNFQIVMGKPQMSDDDGLLSEVGDCKAHFLHVLAIPEYDLDFLHDGSILIFVWSSIDIVNWYWVWQGVSLQL